MRKISLSESQKTRGAGAGPGIGRVSRMHTQEISAQLTRQRGERDAVAKHNRSPVMRWAFVLISLLLLSLGLLGGWWFFLFKGDMASIMDFSKTPSPPAKTALSQFKAPTKDEALALIKRALAAGESTSEISACFALGKSTPENVVEFLSNLEQSDGQLGELEWLGTRNTSQLQIEVVSISFKATDSVKKRLALLTPDAHGVWKIDFDAFTRAANPSWGEFINQEADVATVRVSLSPGIFYQGAFRNDQEWMCYRMESPDRTHLMHGYCKKGSPAERTLVGLFGRGDSDCRVILQLRRVEYSQPYQFEISRVYAEDWVMPPIPLDEVH